MNTHTLNVPAGMSSVSAAIRLASLFCLFFLSFSSLHPVYKHVTQGSRQGTRDHYKVWGLPTSSTNIHTMRHSPPFVLVCSMT